MNCAMKKSNQLCGLSMLCFIDPFVCGSGTQQSSPAAISFQQYHFSKLADSFAEAQQLVGNSSASLSQACSSLIGKHNYTVISGWLGGGLCSGLSSFCPSIPFSDDNV